MPSFSKYILFTTRMIGFCRLFDLLLLCKYFLFILFFVSLFQNIEKYIKRRKNKMEKKSKKYIYFASQYQPEVTTTYIGRYYENFFILGIWISSLIIIFGGVSRLVFRK